MNPISALRSHVSTAVLLCCLAMAFPAAQAAEAEEPADATENGNGAEEQAGESGTPSSEVFIPTEEISEDFAVSFPVDI